MKKIALSILAVAFIGILSVSAQADVQPVNPAQSTIPNQQSPVRTGSDTPGINPGPQTPTGAVPSSSNVTQPGILAEPQATQQSVYPSSTYPSLSTYPSTTYPSTSTSGTASPYGTFPSTTAPSSAPSLSNEPSLNGTNTTGTLNSQPGSQTSPASGMSPAYSSPGTSVPVAKPIIPVTPANPNP